MTEFGPRSNHQGVPITEEAAAIIARSIIRRGEGGKDFLASIDDAERTGDWDTPNDIEVAAKRTIDNFELRNVQNNQDDIRNGAIEELMKDLE
ncbi:MAG TPA: hypothetical protein PKD28_01930 [Candidatus Saccharibacteria bacterium]|nr:hypothetical protein [Candidatus Saccharibacteria bacterium]